VKLLFDNNLSVLLSQFLQDTFPGSKHVFELGIDAFSGWEICQYALEKDFTIISKDLDFYYLADTLGSPPKLVWITIGNCKNRAMMDLLRREKESIRAFLLSDKDILLLS
jgi:predicted nuclease of predicted toxin-antitoxin system